jgi:hypothetical protein
MRGRTAELIAKLPETAETTWKQRKMRIEQERISFRPG